MSRWDLLRQACADMEAWYAPARMAVSAWVCTDAEGRFEGGAHVGGEPMTEDEWGETPMVAGGETFDECASDLARRMRQYRDDRDRERSEWAAEETPR